MYYTLTSTVLVLTSKYCGLYLGKYLSGSGTPTVGGESSFSTSKASLSLVEESSGFQLVRYYKLMTVINKVITMIIIIIILIGAASLFQLLYGCLGTHDLSRRKNWTRQHCHDPDHHYFDRCRHHDHHDFNHCHHHDHNHDDQIWLGQEVLQHHLRLHCSIPAGQPLPELNLFTTSSWIELFVSLFAFLVFNHSGDY